MQQIEQNTRSIIHSLMELTKAYTPVSLSIGSKIPTVFCQVFTAVTSWRNSLIIKLRDREPLYKRVLIQNTSLFDQTLAEHYQSDRINVVYISAAIDPLTGESWCSDCQRALTLVPTLYNLPKLTIFECQIDREEYVNNPQHPYRLHPLIALKRVPTLIHWTDNGPSKRLVEGDLHSSVNICQFQRYLLQSAGIPLSDDPHSDLSQQQISRLISKQINHFFKSQ